jgi:hypothetical protein
MRRGGGRAGDVAAAGQRAGPAAGAAPAAAWLAAWHGELAGWLDRLGWLRAWSEWLGGVLGPVRDRYQDSVVVEVLHGGRWVGHPLHPALSDLPIGLWAGVLVLDVADRGPAARRGLDAAGTSAVTWSSPGG